jgi:hypothetical protein
MHIYTFGAQAHATYRWTSPRSYTAYYISTSPELFPVLHAVFTSIYPSKYSTVDAIAWGARQGTFLACCRTDSQSQGQATGEG